MSCLAGSAVPLRRGTRRTATGAVTLATSWTTLVTVLAGCTYTVAPGTPVSFDSAVVWVRDGADSARLVVEVARTLSQQALGLMDRPTLDAQAGMLFVFEEPRSAGFWMWRTLVPLDVAFIGDDGVVRRILTLEPCPGPDSDACPEHRPGVEYSSALEVNAGWFERNGLGVGAVVRLEEGDAGRPPG